jgi:hypothetical protein
MRTNSRKQEYLFSEDKSYKYIDFSSTSGKYSIRIHILKNTITNFYETETRGKYEIRGELFFLAIPKRAEYFYYECGDVESSGKTVNFIEKFDNGRTREEKNLIDLEWLGSEVVKINGHVLNVLKDAHEYRS